jgi:hypothetical protein
MSKTSYEAPKLLKSKTGKYLVQVYSVVTVNGINRSAAIVLEQIRSYQQPILSGINLLDAELNYYLEK